MIVPVGEFPPLKTASSEIVLPTKTPGEAVVTMVGLAGGGGGGGGGPVQAETGKVPENEPALPSVVWLAVQLEETSALPAESGIGTVNVYVAKGKDTFPLRVVGDPPVGV